MRPFAFLVALVLASAAVSAQPRPDTTFGRDGVVSFDTLNAAYSSARAVAPAPGGGVVVGTYVVPALSGSVAPPSYSLVTRLTRDGRRDAAFGMRGSVRLDAIPGLGSGVEIVDLDVDAAGAVTVLARRSAASALGRTYETVVLRLAPTGALDPIFGVAVFGVATETTPQWPRALALGPDGSVAVAIDVSSTGDAVRGVVARLTPTGVLDATFGVGGLAQTVGSAATDVAVRPDGRIVVAGSTPRPLSDIVVTQFTRAGGPDLTFGMGGRHVEDIFGEADDVATLTLRPDGTAYVTASTFANAPDGTREQGVLVLWLQPDGRPATDFGFQGWTWTDVTAQFGVVPGPALVRPDGGLYVLAAPTDFFRAQQPTLIVGVNRDGTPTDALGPNGVRVVLGAPERLGIAHMRAGETSTVLLAGQRVDVPAEAAVVARVRLDALAVDVAPAPRFDAGLAVAPNPTTGSTRIALTLDAASAIRVTVVDMLGRTVAALADGTLGVGTHSLMFDATRLAPGVYAVVAETPAGRRTTRLTVVR